MSSRVLVAVRDALLQRAEFPSALALWLNVMRKVQLQMSEPKHKVLSSFPQAQTESAHCERTFATIVEMQTRGLKTVFPVFPV